MALYQFPIELEFRMLIFTEGGKPENPKKKPSWKMLLNAFKFLIVRFS
jgi:hypothetical protein